jgi:hypothetical protein
MPGSRTPRVSAHEHYSLMPVRSTLWTNQRWRKTNTTTSGRIETTAAMNS